MANRKRSLWAGILYLLLIIPGPFAYIIIPDMISSQVNANQYISNHMELIYIWLLLDLLIIGIEVFLAIYLYKLLKLVDEKIARIAFVLRALVIMVMVINVSFLGIIILGDYINPLNYVLLHIDFTFIWQFIFSLHVFVLGVYFFKYVKSNFKYLAYVLILGSFGYLLDSLNHFFLDSSIFISLASVLLIFVTLAEIGTGLALILNKVLPKEMESLS